LKSFTFDYKVETYPEEKNQTMLVQGFHSRKRLGHEWSLT